MPSNLSVTLSKSIILDDPRDLVAYVTLSVTDTQGIDKNIFVCKYLPPSSPQDKGTNSFYNVAYVDQLEDVPTSPENRRKACFVRTYTVTKSFPNKSRAETWCTEIYEEIMRLLSTYSLASGEGTAYSVVVTENGYTVRTIGNVVEEAHTLEGINEYGDESNNEESNSVTNGESSESNEESSSSLHNEEEVVLTYDGKIVGL